jgi:hypothetical protein
VVALSTIQVKTLNATNHTHCNAIEAIMLLHDESNIIEPGA